MFVSTGIKGKQSIRILSFFITTVTVKKAKTFQQASLWCCSAFLRQRECLTLLPPVPEWQELSELARSMPAGPEILFSLHSSCKDTARAGPITRAYCAFTFSSLESPESKCLKEKNCCVNDST